MVLQFVPIWASISLGLLYCTAGMWHLCLTYSCTMYNTVEYAGALYINSLVPIQHKICVMYTGYTKHFY